MNAPYIIQTEFNLSSHHLIAGIDEAGRGPLCGDVYAAAVILDAQNPILGLDDSKKISTTKRDALEILIKENALCYCIASASVLEIDTLNILQATLLAMRRAVEGLKITPTQLLIDGNQDPKCSIPTQTIIKGDQTHECIAAASILAKTARDKVMIEMDAQYPLYGFATHKGYGTKKHMEALEKYGITPIHRLSFAPVSKIYYAAQSHTN